MILSKRKTRERPAMMVGFFAARLDYGENAGKG